MANFDQLMHNICHAAPLTRLLGRPQPQMYPPVALNQYTLVNRTHKHFIYIYMLHGPTNILKSHQSSTICKKYGSNLMYIFCFHFGGVLGKRILNPEVLKGGGGGEGVQ